MTYALLIYRSMPPSETLSEKEERAALAAHWALQKKASGRRELHAVARLDDPETARTVKWSEQGHDVTDGPFVETKEWLVGFYVVDCKTEEEALERGRTICKDRHHVIEVRPVTWKWNGP
ncbi:MAG: YciI family protein [Polyangiaceae bacterium]|nr:YciI family protein [Polyangiaceae bacterium]